MYSSTYETCVHMTYGRFADSMRVSICDVHKYIKYVGYIHGKQFVG